MSQFSSSSQRRRAYQCLKCYHRMDKVYIEAKYRVYSHFLKEHMSLDQAPYYCRLCLFRCFKREELEKHVHSFRRHALVLQEKNIPDSPEFLVSNQSPYLITDRDVAVLSAEESKRHWLSISKKPDILSQAIQSVLPDLSPVSNWPLSPFLQQSSPAQPSRLTPLQTFQPQPITYVNLSECIGPLQQLINVIGTSTNTPTLAPNQLTLTSLPPSHTAQTEAPQAIIDQEDPLTTLPTIEECRALAPEITSDSSSSSGSSSSSSSVSSNSSVKRHNELMDVLADINNNLKNIHTEINKQYCFNCDFTKSMADLTDILRSQNQPTQPAAECPPPTYHHPDYSHSNTHHRLDHSATETSSVRYNQHRDRSPLRPRNHDSRDRHDKENHRDRRFVHRRMY
ncbi:hypothetical protein DPMN_049192 [Dreissena polymorpha]|uniref:Uncharacterized protein n=1 Tax=Dreissena polymorpha TaxID=45954 RepID=A0A9D4I305_DREPO|nr:hypothetical protein DPMN_049192 [Dreissena polymorpha]